MADLEVRVATPSSWPKSKRIYMSLKAIWNWINNHQENLLGAGLILGFLLIGVIYVRGPVLLDKYLVNQLDAETTGKLLNIERNIVVHEDRLGGHVRIGGLTITYQYTVEYQVYKREEYLNRRSLKQDADLFLLHASLGDSLIVRYDSKDPSKARWLRENK